MRKLVLSIIIAFTLANCSSIPKKTATKINSASKKELNILKPDKVRYIKDKRSALLIQFLNTKVGGSQNIQIAESFNLLHTPYSVVFALKTNDKVSYFEANERTNQKLNMLKLKENDLATRTYYNIIFRLTDVKDYDTLKGLYKERGVSHSKFCNYYQLSLDKKKYTLQDFIHFKDFGLLDEELTGQDKN